MDATIKTKWLDALRSGEYKQGQDVLHNPKENTYCCLGVLCEIAVQEGVIGKHVDSYEAGGEDFTYAAFDSAQHYLPPSVSAWAGIRGSNPEVDPNGANKTVASLNDRGMSFDQIADVIEKAL